MIECEIEIMAVNDQLILTVETPTEEKIIERPIPAIDPGAMNDPRQHVASQMVGAHPVLRAGWLQHRDQIDRVRVGRDPRRERRRAQPKRQDRAAGDDFDRAFAMAQRRAGGDGRGCHSRTRGSIKVDRMSTVSVTSTVANA